MSLKYISLYSYNHSMNKYYVFTHFIDRDTDAQKA